MAASREAPNVILPFDWDNSTEQREWSEVRFVSIKDHLELVCNCLLDPDALMVVCGLALLPLQSGALLSNPIATLPESTFVSLASLKPIHPNLVPLLSRTLSTLTGSSEASQPPPEGTEMGDSKASSFFPSLCYYFFMVKHTSSHFFKFFSHILHPSHKFPSLPPPSLLLPPLLSPRSTLPPSISPQQRTSLPRTSTIHGLICYYKTRLIPSLHGR